MAACGGTRPTDFRSSAEPGAFGSSWSRSVPVAVTADANVETFGRCLPASGGSDSALSGFCLAKPNAGWGKGSKSARRDEAGPAAWGSPGCAVTAGSVLGCGVVAPRWPIGAPLAAAGALPLTLKTWVGGAAERPIFRDLIEREALLLSKEWPCCGTASASLAGGGAFAFNSRAVRLPSPPVRNWSGSEMGENADVNVCAGTSARLCSTTTEGTASSGPTLTGLAGFTACGCCGVTPGPGVSWAPAATPSAGVGLGLTAAGGNADGVGTREGAEAATLDNAGMGIGTGKAWALAVAESE